MTVQTAETKTHYAGNGLTTEWPIPFPVVQEEHIKLIKTSPDGEDEEITTGYTVNGMESGAVSITYPMTGEPLESGWQLTIYRDMPLTQTLDLESGGAFDAEVLERQGFDHVVMQIQQLQEQTARALQLAITDIDRTPDEVLGEMFELRDAAQQALAAAEDALEVANAAAQLADDTSQSTQGILTQVEDALGDTATAVTAAGQALSDMAILMSDVQALAASLETLGDAGQVLQDVETALADMQAIIANLQTLAEGTATTQGLTPTAPAGWKEGWALTLAADGSTTYSPKPDTPVDGKSIVLNASKQVAAGTHLPGVASFQTRSISNGAISPTAADVVVDTEGAAAADDLTDINVSAAQNGMILRLWAASEARVITVKSSVTLRLSGWVDRVLSQHGYLELKRNGSYWQETPREDVLELRAGKLDSTAAFGIGQDWQFVTGQRAWNTGYSNTTGRPIEISVTANQPGPGNMVCSIEVWFPEFGEYKIISTAWLPAAALPGTLNLSAIIPPWRYYRATRGQSTAGILVWCELR